jgi:hypothetical protein
LASVPKYVELKLVDVSPSAVLPTVIKATMRPREIVISAAKTVAIETKKSELWVVSPLSTKLCAPNKNINAVTAFEVSQIRRAGHFAIVTPLPRRKYVMMRCAIKKNGACDEEREAGLRDSTVHGSEELFLP